MEGSIQELFTLVTAHNEAVLKQLEDYQRVLEAIVALLEDQRRQPEAHVATYEQMYGPLTAMDVGEGTAISATLLAHLDQGPSPILPPPPASVPWWRRWFLRDGRL